MKTLVRSLLKSRCRPNSCRNGFTLVELLVVISIMGFIGGMFAIAYRGAQQESNTQKTRSTVEKISRIVVSAYEDYTSEPLGVGFNGDWDARSSAYWSPPTGNPLERARTRLQRVERTALLIIRDRIRMEMPDNADDIKWTRMRTGPYTGSGIDPDSIIRQVLSQARGEIVNDYGYPNDPLPLPPATWAVTRSALSTRAIRLVRKLSIIEGGYYRPIVNWELNNANAELLFAIVEDATADGATALEAFGASEIGDTDGDGLKEFIDAWGNPIGWIRWPSGSPEVLFSHPDPVDPRLLANGRLALADEPYDKFASDPGQGTNFPSSPMGMPLVVSAGVDGIFGIRLALEPIPAAQCRAGTLYANSRSVADCIWTYDSSSWLPIGRNFCDPWYPRTPTDNRSRLGAPLTADQSSDDITNLQGTGAAL